MLNGASAACGETRAEVFRPKVIGSGNVDVGHPPFDKAISDHPVGHVLIGQHRARVDITAVDIEAREPAANFLQIREGHRLADIGSDDGADRSIIDDRVADDVDFAKDKALAGCGWQGDRRGRCDRHREIGRRRRARRHARQWRASVLRALAGNDDRVGDPGLSQRTRGRSNPHQGRKRGTATPATKPRGAAECRSSAAVPHRPSHAAEKGIF